ACAQSTNREQAAGAGSLFAATTSPAMSSVSTASRRRRRSPSRCDPAKRAPIPGTLFNTVRRETESRAINCLNRKACNSNLAEPANIRGVLSKNREKDAKSTRHKKTIDFDLF